MTGINIRQVLDYAKTLDCVFFLDELDALAKRRDDEAEIGELKRLVTVLLQEIDNWPSEGILVAATNHPELLDPAVWRRFDLLIEFPMPDHEQTVQSVSRFLEPNGIDRTVTEIVAIAFGGMSYCDIDRELRRLHRESVISGEALDSRLREPVRERMQKLPAAVRKEATARLLALGLSAREANEWTGLHRGIMRKMAKPESGYQLSSKTG